MSYSWIEPKTDWTPTDKFTFTDYNRIRNNLLYINEKINELYPDKYLELDLGEEKTDYSQEYSPSEFNAFEDALISFERTGKDYNLGERYYHYDNSPFAWDDVLIRLEKCTLRWKKISEIPVTKITLRPHDANKVLMYLGDYAIYDVIVEPSNATLKNEWTVTNGRNACVYYEKINNTQVKATYVKGADAVEFKHGSLPYEELCMTTKGTLSQNLIASIGSINSNSCMVKFIAQGSYVNKYEERGGKTLRQYYKFTKIADNIDGRGITTFLMTLTELDAMTFGSTNRVDANAPWRKAFKGVTNFSFSYDLGIVLRAVAKNVMGGSNVIAISTDKFHLPSYTEFGSQISKCLPLGSAYPYLASNDMYFGKEGETKTITRSLREGGEGALVDDKLFSLYSSRTSSLAPLYPDVKTNINPLVFLDSSLTVVEYHENYKIDWSRESNLTLADIPLGSIVFDIDGNKGDLSQKAYVESITLNKQSIRMKIGAIQTITFNVSPLNALNKDKLNIYWTGENNLVIKVDYQNNTITVKGTRKGTAQIVVEADEFPNEPVRAVCDIEITEITAQDLALVRKGTTTPVQYGIAKQNEETVDYDILVLPENVETIDNLTVDVNDPSKMWVGIENRSGNRVTLRTMGYIQSRLSDELYIIVNIDSLRYPFQFIVEREIVLFFTYQDRIGLVREMASVPISSYVDVLLRVAWVNIEEMQDLVISVRNTGTTLCTASVIDMTEFEDERGITGVYATIRINGLQKTTYGDFSYVNASLRGKTATITVSVS